MSCGIRDIWTTATVTIIAIFLISAIIMISSYVYHRITQSNQQDHKSDKSLLYIASIFSICAILFFVIYIMYLSHACYIYRSIYTAPFLIIYNIQFYCVIMFWLLRLYNMFKDTGYSLSKCTFMFFTLCYGILTFLTIMFQILYVINFISPKMFSLLSAAALFFVIIGSLSISVLFITKLIHLYKASEILNVTHPQHKSDKVEKSENDRALLEYIMTKITILTLQSLFTTLLTSISIVLRFMFVGSLLAEFFAHFMFTFDVYTNLICIMLSFTYYSNLYNKMYYIHRLCVICCRKISGNNLNAQIYVENRRCTANIDNQIIVQNNTTNTVTSNIAAFNPTTTTSTASTTTSMANSTISSTTDTDSRVPQLHKDITAFRDNVDSIVTIT
eukprot:248586_1